MQRIILLKTLFWLFVSRIASSFSSPLLHSRTNRQRSSTLFDSNNPWDAISNSMGFQRQQFERAQYDGFGTRARNAAINATVGDVLVPLCSNIMQRQELANQGVYAGVEYKICSLMLPEETEVQTLQGLDLQAKQGVVAMVKPAYPLRTHLERDDWPVSIDLEAVPLWLSKATYEAGTAVGTLLFSSSLLIIAAIVAFFIRFVNCPTPSMVPALNPGNIILVTRSIPSLGILKPKVGDVVFFDAPSELELVVDKFAAEQSQQSSSSSSSNDIVSSIKGKQFLKRVVAVPGETVGVKKSEPYVKLDERRYRFDVIGPYARPEVFADISWNRQPTRLDRKEYFVAGDNGYRSVDSRVWGPLKEKYIVGTAKWVLWPIEDFGPIPNGQISEVTKKDVG